MTLNLKLMHGDFLFIHVHLNTVCTSMISCKHKWNCWALIRTVRFANTPILCSIFRDCICELTEMTQSATGFLRALSAVSLSLLRSIAVICSMLNTFSSSMYITTTYNTRVLKDKNSSQSLHSRTLCLALKEGFTAKTRPLNNAGTMWSVSSQRDVFARAKWMLGFSFSYSPLCPSCPMASVTGHKPDWTSSSGQKDLKTPGHGNAWILGQCYCNGWPSVFQSEQKTWSQKWRLHENTRE